MTTKPPTSPVVIPDMGDRIFGQDGINPYLAAGWALIDDIIDPRETRQQLLHALLRTRNKTVERPARKRPVMPV
jgi:acetyl-CoA carboxylase carboxyltransferase component